ncbi:MAG: hypothetical protein GY696_11195, partial [Gammaproteobacteria bacterium]|nr:hypothetical protein [Gammaproteobacteria bacterium]
LEVSEDLRKALDNQLAGLLVLLDMSKAFDCIQHPILLAKLERYGVTGVALDRFKSYLSDRYQNVCLRSGASTILSESCPVPCGVPQGSILGPLLFLVAVNDLPSVLKVLHVTQFADDTQLHVTCENVHLPAILREVQMELGAIAQWMKLNRLKLNATKSVCLRLGKWNTQAMNPLVLNNHPIPNASSAKNLGIVFDDQLRFKDHVLTLVSDCRRRLSQIARSCKDLPRRSKASVVESLVLSKLRYCAPIWGGIGPTLQNDIQSVLNFAAKVVFSKRKYDRASHLIAQLGWLRAPQLLEYETLKMSHRILRNRAPAHLADLLHKPSHRYATRFVTKGKFEVPVVHKKFGLETFGYRSAKSLNSLPDGLIDTVSRERFKADAKNFLQSKVVP